MKVFSKQFIIFLILFASYTIVFRIGLSHFLREYQPTWLGFISIFYGVIIFITAFILGWSDGQKNVFFDIGLRWNLGSLIIWSVISALWLLLGHPADLESVYQLIHPLFIWGSIAIVHTGFFLWLRRKTIKGIHKSEIFE